ncbi:hypothetical protein R3P38DRAFT_2683798 [Favolaschia claudopus]|uniref:Uncharacterized protein n=1 Tax=Favolaschia claudopus TaxID=2862362 RepID=A0AAW0DS41_9AGAR
MDYESSDILGANTLPVRTPSSPKWPGYLKITICLVVLLGVYVAAVRGWTELLKWREKSYRLSMRRQHGIPDSDHRPFNVAYAAVLRARREEEVANNRVDVDELYAEADRRAAPVESDIRQRKNMYRISPPTWTKGAISGLPGKHNPLAPDNRFAAPSSGLPASSSFQTNFAERYNPNPAPPAHVVRFADEIQDASLPRRGGATNLTASPRKQQKRALEDYEVESDVAELPKKTRVEGDELIDGDEDAEWSLPRQRGEKRVLHDEDLEEDGADEDENVDARANRRARGKRARKVRENPDVFMTSDDGADEMDVDATESPAYTVRGKKRDAVSSFEGEEDDEELAKKTKRKRRSSGKTKSAPAPSSSRGQKRDRDGEEEEGSEGEDGTPATSKGSSRKTKKRGKKTKEVREDDDEEAGDASKGKPRAIGDQWESNGVLYKIGVNGQRLRQALVKKAARRFTMPMDSQHPDKTANLEVCIETWLTEEEYKDLKSRHLLAWQDSPKGTQEPESNPPTPAAEMPSTPTPAARGKNLLWDSPASPFPVFAPSPAEKEQHRPQTHFRQSIATDVGMRVNPFDKANALHVGAEAGKSGLRNGRRVGAGRDAASPALPGLADSTNSVAAQVPAARRTFSKWEKQDLEAKAMMKMREANQAKQKEKELKERLEREKKEAAAIPRISLTPAEPAKPPAISFTPSTSSAAPQVPSFSLAPTTPAAEPSKALSAPSAPADKPQPPATNLFAPPASADKPQQSIPNFFAAPAPAAPQSASTPAPAPTPAQNPFAPKPPASQQPQQPSSAPAPKPATASWAPAPAPAIPGANTTQTTPSFWMSEAEAKANAERNAGPATLITAEMRRAEEAEKAAALAAANARTGGTPLFSFKQAAPAPAAAPGSSLLSRMGPTPAVAAAPAPKPAETTAAPKFSFMNNKPAGDPAKTSPSPSPFAAPQQQQAEPAKSPFSFKPVEQQQQAAKPASVFAPQAQAQPQAAPAANPAGAVTAPKFNFAFAAKPAAAAAASTTSSSSLTNALGPGSGTNTNANTPAASAPTPAAATTTAPAFSFAQPKPAGDKPAFGFTAPSATPTPAANAEGEKKSVFAFNSGGAGTSGPSAFGPSSGAPSPFASGLQANPAMFGATSSPSATPAATPAASVFGTPKPADASTGTTPAAPTPAPAFNFAFGGNNTVSTTPAGTPTVNPFAAKPPVFGAPSTNSVFGKPAAEGTGTTTPQGSPFAFGSKPVSPSPFGAPAAAAGAPSLFGSTATNAGALTPSAFGFGATPSAFGQQK